MLDLDPTTIRSIEAADEVRQSLEERVRELLSASEEKTWRVSRVEVSVPEGILPLDWLRAQEMTEAVYWSGRDDDWRAAALGVADVLGSSTAPLDYEALHRRLASRLEAATRPIRYYGGLRFDAGQPPVPHRPDRRWAAFGTYRFVLPRFELVEREDAVTLACNLVLPRDLEQAEEIVGDLHRLALPLPEDPVSLPRPLRRTDVPERAEWTSMVRWALKAIEDEALDKVVLARRVGLALNTDMDPMLVLRHLEAATPGSFHFAFRPNGAATFMGASPERLFRREENRIVSEAVAGTRSRGETPSADEALRQELLQSPKERREHAFVQEAIRSALQEVCSSVEVPEETAELALARGRHLHSRLTGTLTPGTSTVDLLEVLHPTPAVGGVPTTNAVSAIRSQEPFDRGWYAGPVGWIGSEDAEFAVALRTGLVEEQHLALFSGAGIVDGSVPDREWEEIEQKIGDFAAVLGLDDREG